MVDEQVRRYVGLWTTDNTTRVPKNVCRLQDRGNDAALSGPGGDSGGRGRAWEWARRFGSKSRPPSLCTLSL